MKPTPLRIASLVFLLALALHGHLFGQAQEIPTQPIPAGATYELGFSPGGTALAVALHAIQIANHRIVVAAYEFTSRPIAKALIAAAARGVQVAIVADYKASLERYSVVPTLEQNGIVVRRDRHYAIMHNKYMVIDGQDLETGSFNYTSAAVEHNAENALLLLDVPELAAQYAAEWQRLWNESQ